MKKIFVSLVILLNLCSKNIVANPEKPTCDEVLVVCSDYVGSLEEQNNSLVSLVKRQQERVDELSLEAEKVSWYWYLLGGIVTGIAISKVGQ